MEFERELRYYVLKRKDVEKYLTPIEQTILNLLADKCAIGRMESGKSILNCVCVEQDWPEYEQVWDMIQKRMEIEQSLTVVEGDSPKATAP